jgi:hypothetical protein
LTLSFGFCFGSDWLRHLFNSFVYSDRSKAQIVRSAKTWVVHETVSAIFLAVTQRDGRDVHRLILFPSTLLNNVPIKKLPSITDLLITIETAVTQHF